MLGGVRHGGVVSIRCSTHPKGVKRGLGNRLLGAVRAVLARRYGSRAMDAADRARLDALDPRLRAWARADRAVREHLARYIRGRMTLGEALARLAAGYGDDAVRERIGYPSERFVPWCARELPGGLRCRSLVATLVVLRRGGAVACCAECAQWHEREGTAREVRRARGAA